MTKFQEYLARKQAEHGEKFSRTELDSAAQFIPYFNSGARIEVRTTYASGEIWTRRGRVGVTTGWRPAFLLISRRGAHGSSDVLGARDTVVKIVSA